MSYGIKVINPGVNRVILDGSSPLYVIPPTRTASRTVGYNSELSLNYNELDKWIPPFGTPVNANTYDQWARDNFIIKQTFEVLLEYPLTSTEPPLVFVSQNIPSAGIWSEMAGNRHSWLANTTFTPIGTPGRWTGMRFEMFATEWFNYFHGDAADQRRALAEMIRSRGKTPDLSGYFILVGHGVAPSVNGYGLVVYDSNGRVVFNSNSNVAKAVGASSGWQYLGRSGNSGVYDERWRLKESAPSPNAYVLFHPHQRCRRYNGEISLVGMSSVKGTPHRIIVGGRSGSPVHTPLMWIEPMKPIERW